MSEKRTKAAKRAANAKIAQGTKNTWGAKGNKNLYNQSALPKNLEAINELASKNALWLSLGLCVSVILNIVLIVLLIVGNKGDVATDADSNNDTASTAFFHSESIADDGFWKDVRALDYVALFNYRSLSIPKEVHEFSDADIQFEVYGLLDNYSPETTQVTNRAVAYGDKVNIDYVGSVDGVEFENGSTEGEGTDVTAGSSKYIDDFLTQIIGHKPGETFEVKVTFPENYGHDNLNGKDAVFVTTINYITDYGITNALVKDLLYDEYGWETVKQMKDGVLAKIQKTAIQNYITDYMVTEVVFTSIPDEIVTYQDRYTDFEVSDQLEYYQGYADSNDMDIDTILQLFEGLSGKDAFIEQIRSGIEQDMKLSLVIQAIAEDAGISISDEDMDNYLPGYTSYEESYGLPWLKQYVLGLKILDLVYDNCVLA